MYHDARPAAVNDDYDAINWMGTFDENGHVEMSMPVSEFGTDAEHLLGAAVKMGDAVLGVQGDNGDSRRGIGEICFIGLGRLEGGC